MSLDISGNELVQIIDEEGTRLASLGEVVNALAPCGGSSGNASIPIGTVLGSCLAMDETWLPMDGQYLETSAYPQLNDLAGSPGFTCSLYDLPSGMVFHSLGNYNEAIFGLISDVDLPEGRTSKIGRSVDYGQTWEIINNCFGSGGVSVNSQTVLMTNGTAVVIDADGIRSFKTTDSGYTWTELQQNGSINDIKTAVQSNSGLLYCLSLNRKKLYVSDDLVSWQTYNLSTEGILDLTVFNSSAACVVDNSKEYIVLKSPTGNTCLIDVVDLTVAFQPGAVGLFNKDSMVSYSVSNTVAYGDISRDSIVLDSYEYGGRKPYVVTGNNQFGYIGHSGPYPYIHFIGLDQSGRLYTKFSNDLVNWKTILVNNFGRLSKYVKPFFATVGFGFMGIVQGDAYNKFFVFSASKTGFNLPYIPRNGDISYYIKV